MVQLKLEVAGEKKHFQCGTWDVGRGVKIGMPAAEGLGHGVPYLPVHTRY